MLEKIFTGQNINSLAHQIDNLEIVSSNSVCVQKLLPKYKFESMIRFPLDDLLDSDSSEDRVDTIRIPTCPNGLHAMQYSDGRPVMCLPGRSQCPENSVCYFNGMDFFCCPNADDPYDHHIFGGYDGEEVKHGYKYAPSKLNIRRLRDDPSRKRLRRQAGMIPMSFDMENFNQPLRFDCKFEVFGR